MICAFLYVCLSHSVLSAWQRDIYSKYLALLYIGPDLLLLIIDPVPAAEGPLRELLQRLVRHTLHRLLRGGQGLGIPAQCKDVMKRTFCLSFYNLLLFFGTSHWRIRPGAAVLQAAVPAERRNEDVRLFPPPLPGLWHGQERDQSLQPHGRWWAETVELRSVRNISTGRVHLIKFVWKLYSKLRQMKAKETFCPKETVSQDTYFVVYKWNEWEVIYITPGGSNAFLLLLLFNDFLLLLQIFVYRQGSLKDTSMW